MESFKAWKTKFDQQAHLKKQQAEEERLRLLSPKEREEWKRAQGRLSGAPKSPRWLLSQH